MPTTIDDGFAREAIRAMYLNGELQPPPVTAHELRMTGNRSRLRIGFKLPVAVAAAVALIVVLFAVPLRHQGHSSASTTTARTPRGWLAHSAYGLQISAPRSWSVSYFPGCSLAQRPGALAIGQSDVAYFCPSSAGPGTVVSLYEGPVPQVWASVPKAISVNDVHILAATNNRETTWYVPSAHVYVSGTGPGSSEVLHTLGKATPNAAKAPGVGKGSAYLEALLQVPISGTATVKNLASGRLTTVQFANGQFTYEGAPGLYTVTVSSGNTPCAPVSASIASGRYTTWPPIKCQGE
jgi:hypothetical protein